MREKLVYFCCLCFSPFNSILIGNILNNFPEVESVLPVTVIVQ